MASVEANRDEGKAIRWDSATTDIETGRVSDTDATDDSTLTKKSSLYDKLRAIAGRYGVEQRGIERVPDDERTDSSISQVGTMVRPPAYPHQSGPLLPLPRCSGFL